MVSDVSIVRVRHTLYLFYMLVHLYTGTEQWPHIHTILPPPHWSPIWPFIVHNKCDGKTRPPNPWRRSTCPFAPPQFFLNNSNNNNNNNNINNKIDSYSTGTEVGNFCLVSYKCDPCQSLAALNLGGGEREREVFTKWIHISYGCVPFQIQFYGIYGPLYIISRNSQLLFFDIGWI